MVNTNDSSSSILSKFGAHLANEILLVKADRLTFCALRWHITGLLHLYEADSLTDIGYEQSARCSGPV